MAKFREKWKITEEGKVYMEQMKEVSRVMNDWRAMRADAERYPRCSAVNSKGRFRVEDVPQGNWVLTVEITNPRSRMDRSVPFRFDCSSRSSPRRFLRLRVDAPTNRSISEF